MPADRTFIARRRIQVLLGVDNESAQACAVDADKCLTSWARGERHPNSGANAQSLLPRNWVESAEMWVARGGAHAFGFNLPAEW